MNRYLLGVEIKDSFVFSLEVEQKPIGYIGVIDLTFVLFGKRCVTPYERNPNVPFWRIHNSILKFEIDVKCESIRKATKCCMLELHLASCGLEWSFLVAIHDFHHFKKYNIPKAINRLKRFNSSFRKYWLDHTCRVWVIEPKKHFLKIKLGISYTIKTTIEFNFDLF